jgi:hypothetical protein
MLVCVTSGVLIIRCIKAGKQAEAIIMQEPHRDGLVLVDALSSQAVSNTHETRRKGSGLSPCLANWAIGCRSARDADWRRLLLTPRSG